MFIIKILMHILLFNTDEKMDIIDVYINYNPYIFGGLFFLMFQSMGPDMCKRNEVIVHLRVQIAN